MVHHRDIKRNINKSSKRNLENQYSAFARTVKWEKRAAKKYENKIAALAKLSFKFVKQRIRH